MKRNVTIAAISSFILALVVPPLFLIAFDQRWMPKDGVQYPQDFPSWSATAQNDWRLSNYRLVSGIELFVERLRHDSAFGIEYLRSTASVFVIGLAGNLLFVFLSSALVSLKS